MRLYTADDRPVRSRPTDVLHIARLPMLFTLLLTLLSCSESVPYDLQTVHTAGAGRSHYWANVEIDPFEYFAEIEIEGLERGFLGPPLPLSVRLLALISTEHEIVLLRDKKLYRTIRLPEGITLMPQLGADSTGRLYVSSTDADLFAIDTNGTIAWRSEAVAVTSESFALPLWPLVIGDMIITGHTDGEVVALDRDGSERWRRSFGSDLSPSTALSAEFGIVIAQTSNDYGVADTLVMLGRDGTERWSVATGGRVDVGPICDESRVIVGVVGENDEGKYRPAIEVYDAASGRLQWRAPLKVLPRGVATGSEGMIFASGGGGSRGAGGVVAAFDVDGKKAWEIALEQSIPSTILATSNAIFFTARQNRSIGIFCYTHAGSFLKYAPIDTPGGLSLPPTILPTGTLVLVSRERPMLIENQGGGILF